MMNDYLILRRCLEGARDFSPTCSEAECGVKGRHIVRGILKGYNISTPHFATLHVGLKYSVPPGLPETLIIN
ncbi:hypothetical protein Barb6_01848 [Bacteroidales bacterium Barb6]|nr:hypothetical protein Barb6_01848 [Bacteroidales bacterium Barb6]